MDDIDSSNLYMLRKTCLYDAIVFGVMSVFEYLLIPGFSLTPGHVTMTVLLVLYFFINRYTSSHKIPTVWVSITCLAFYCWMNISSILIDIYSTGNIHTHWTPMVIIVFPVLFIDRRFKYFIEEMFIVCAFGIIKYAYDPSTFLADFYIVFTAMVISLPVSNIMLGIRSSRGLSMTELKHISSYDKLTRLLNRAALVEKIDKYLADRPLDMPVAMCVIDVDDFKSINDSLGHSVGDKVLERVGKLLLMNFRPEDIVGRFGGDEFVVFMPGMQDSAIIEMRCRGLQMMLTDFNLGNNKPVSLSIGIVVDKGHHSRQEIFDMADDALYGAKLRGKNNSVCWTFKEDIYPKKPLLIQITIPELAKANILRENESDRFDIISIGSGEEAIQCISQYHKIVSLIVIELNENAKDGAFLLSYLKNRDRFTDIRILTVTNSDLGARIAKELGADEALTCDTSPDIFREIVGKLTGIG